MHTPSSCEERLRDRVSLVTLGHNFKTAFKIFENRSSILPSSGFSLTSPLNPRKLRGVSLEALCPSQFLVDLWYAARPRFPELACSAWPHRVKTATDVVPSP